MYPEAQSLALEALAEVQPSTTDRKTALEAQLSLLSDSVVQQAHGLLALLEGGDVDEIEKLYSALSCTMSELRHLRSDDGASESHMKHRTGSGQQLPNELVLRSLQFANEMYQNLQFSVFPRLSRSAHHLSSSSPQSLGVFQLIPFRISELSLPRPRCVGCIALNLCPFRQLCLCHLTSL